MDWISIILISIALSMDSFAVSTTCGVILKRYRWAEASVIGSFMALAQALMPVLGYFAAVSFRKYIVEWDHWIAFTILIFLGIKMIIEGIKGDDGNKDFCPMKPKVLFAMSLATSVDALAVGISFAFLNILLINPVVAIGVVTFIFSVFGVWVGSHSHRLLKIKFEILGGLALIGIGTKILIEHLYFS